MKVRILTLIILVFIASSCDKNFEEMNKSEDLVTSPTLDFMIPTIQLNLFEKSYYTHYTMLGILSKHIHGSNVDSYKSQSTTMAHLFDDIYPKTIKNVVDVIEKTKDKDELVNYWAMATIMRAYEISRMTDAYGDVPYTEAGLGYEQQLFYPKYDAQKDIYQGIIAELFLAASKFDDAKKKVPAGSDIIYKGDFQKWKRLAHSLVLRYSMRMVNVDAEGAKANFLKALDLGVMQSNEDSFIVFYLPDTYYATTANGNAAANKYDYKITDVLINQMKATADPRLPVYAMLPNGNNAANLQKGFVLFTSDKTDKKTVSTPNTKTYAKYDAPYVHMSYAESELLRAEASLRGWVNSDAEIHFRNGVKANLDMQAIYGEAGKISAVDVMNYVHNLPFDKSNYSSAFTSIHTQLWIMFFFNWNEAFANWRRTGIPDHSSIDEKINRRLIYPQSEWNSNTKHVREAIDRQGDDNVMTRMWWDKN